MSCCSARATGPDMPIGNVSIANLGTGAKVYVEGTGPDPFYMRTIRSNGTIDVIETTEHIELNVDIAIQNEGGFAEIYDEEDSTPNIRLLRTLQSSDLSIQVLQNDNNIDLRASPKTYYDQKSDVGSTNNTTYVTVSTMASVASGVVGEAWVFVASCLVCHPSGLTTVNTKLRWQIEGPAATWNDLETNMNINEPQTIAVGQRSSPRTRTYQAVLAMNAPRLRLQVAMSAAVATGGQLEYAQVSGYKR